MLQATAETALDMLTPGPALALPAAASRRERRRRRDSARHPADIREGVASAYNTMREVRRRLHVQRLNSQLHSGVAPPSGVFKT